METLTCSTPTSGEVNFLGVIVDGRLSSSEHISSITPKLGVAVFTIRRLKQVLTQKPAN